MEKPHSEIAMIIARLDMIYGRTIKTEELIVLLFTDIIEMKTITATMLEFMDIDASEYREKYASIYEHLMKRSHERIATFYDQGALSQSNEYQMYVSAQLIPNIIGLS